MSDFFEQLFSPKIMPLLIPIVAILGGLIYLIIKRLIVHRERMAMIERGIHPDYPPEDEKGGPPAKQ